MTRRVVGLCGSHGSGKTTIVNHVRAMHGAVDETPSLSRAAQAALGWDDMSRAEESAANMWALQDAILAAMRQRDETINAGTIPMLVDRTPADLIGYTLLWLSRIPQRQVDWKRYDSYKMQCLQLASRYRRQLFVPFRPEIVFVPESDRADEASRTFHHDEVKKFLSQSGFPYSQIVSLDPKERAREAILWL